MERVNEPFSIASNFPAWEVQGSGFEPHFDSTFLQHDSNQLR